MVDKSQAHLLPHGSQWSQQMNDNMCELQKHPLSLPQPPSNHNKHGCCFTVLLLITRKNLFLVAIPTLKQEGRKFKKM